MMKRIAGFLRRSESECGQSILAFIVLVPVFIVALFVVTDIGRYLYIKNQVRIAADSAALAAAGALDITKAGNGEFVLNEAWADARARSAIAEMGGRVGEDNWLEYDVTSVLLDGAEVTVIVEGNGSSLFGGYLGISEFNARAMAHARAAVGVDSEW